MEAPRPLYTAGGIAAATSAAIGLAVLTTLTLIGWVAAPHASFGVEIPDVFRLVVQAWLVGHLAGFAIPGGDVAMLPLGLVVLPGLVLYRSGRWLARSCELPRVRHVFQAALAIAGPYAAIAGTLALTAHTELVQPSMPQALAAGFAVAYVAGGLGVLRQLLIDKDIARRRLLRLMPRRPRSLLLGSVNAAGLLLAAGLTLFLAGLVANAGEAAAVTSQLRPGIVGGILLLILQLLYLPNAVIFGMSYAAGPGFAVGAETIVAPTGVSYGQLPQLPMLAALPEEGPAPLVSLIALAAPFLAGAVGGWRTLRTAPTPVSEAAPLWGLACGAVTGVVCAALALLAGGPLGAQRLAVVGPSAWQVGAAVAIQVGVVAAIAGWITNWVIYRRQRRATSGAVTSEADPEIASDAEGDLPTPVAEGKEDAGEAGAQTPLPPRRGSRLRELAQRMSLRSVWPRLRRGGSTVQGQETAPDAAEDAESTELFGISYEADPQQEPPTAPVPDEGTAGAASVTYLAARRQERGN
ncbi:DUF6350 family protein [Lipingzhangella sp. LS1_29]|uniref:DUF6350 family protein n=1 Tax=Lipingzhangella rawalii TaxID=2055835 RepID=A0ABU2H4S4_9ACTN|nr:DUF6350 family protein [Lipingzhangella rawalii]MDS1270313.1 DUF6350 family protein [Lipingzhangella rawalii]